MVVTDSHGAPIPVVDAAAAHGSALGLRRAAAAGEECLGLLAAAVAPEWSGVASQGYLDGRAAVSRRASDLVEASGVLSRAIVEFGDEAAMVCARWRSEAERLAELELTVADPARAGLDVAALGTSGLDALVADRDSLRLEVAAWERRFGDALAALVSAARQVSALLDDGVLSTSEQLWEIPTTVTELLVVEPLALADLLIDDPSQGDDVAKSMWLGSVERARHPIRSLQEMFGTEQFADGRWGEGVGTGLATIAGIFGTKGLGRVPDADLDTVRPSAEASADTCAVDVGSGGGLSIPMMMLAAKKTCGTVSLVAANRFAHNIQRSDAPRPRTQTLDEMQAGVDLDASEHADLGHVLSRHVDVNEDYLRYRLMVGTPETDGARSKPPRAASAWADRATAEASITRAIDEHRGQLDRWMQSGDDSLTLPVTGEDLGRVMRLDGDGEPYVQVANHARIVFERRGDEVFIKTTLLDHVPKEGTP